MKKFFMSVLWVALFASLIAMYFYQTSFDKRLVTMNDRSDVIVDKYQSYDDNLHNYDVRLMGARKHINLNSQRFLALEEDLNMFKEQHSSDMFYLHTRIDSLANVVDMNKNELRGRVDNVDKKVSNLRRTVTQNNIRATQELNKISRDLEKLENKVTELDTTTVKVKKRR